MSLKSSSYQVEISKALVICSSLTCLFHILDSKFFVTLDLWEWNLLNKLKHNNHCVAIISVINHKDNSKSLYLKSLFSILSWKVTLNVDPFIHDQYRERFNSCTRDVPLMAKEYFESVPCCVYCCLHKRYATTNQPKWDTKEHKNKQVTPMLTNNETQRV